jgi:hypothetical protein
MSVRAVSRISGLNQGTILSILLTAGDNCRAHFDFRVRGIRPRFVQADELWTFVHTKERHLRPGAPMEWGDAYIWMAIDSERRTRKPQHSDASASFHASEAWIGKSLDHLKATASLYMAFFNFVRVHQTVCVTSTESGLTDHVWTVQNFWTHSETLDFASHSLATIQQH